MRTRWGQVAAANAGRASYLTFDRTHLVHLANHGTPEQRRQALRELWRRDHNPED